MVDSYILSAHAEVLSIIFSYIIFELNDFCSFSKLLIIWERNQPRDRVKDVLERLDWNQLYYMHQTSTEVTFDQFLGFIDFAVRNNVHQAMFYDSVWRLFRQTDVEHNLSILRSLSGNHLPSSFAFLFFKSIYRPFDITETSEEMAELLNQTHLRSSLLEVIYLLEDIYNNITYDDYLTPVYKFCPNARNNDPIYKLHGPPYLEELWFSLCEETVEEEFRNDQNPFGKPLTMQHVWDTPCKFCKTQLIVFRILLNSVWM